MPKPIYTTIPLVVHVSKDYILHPTARIANVSVMSQTEIHIPTPSISSDLPSFNLIECEGMPTSTQDVHDSLSNLMIRMKHSCATQTKSSDLTSLHQSLTEDFLN